MMPEQKGRSGKKPKYQIPDIGGADLTAEDISTERVLNFLIKGEAPSTEQTDSPDAAMAEGNDSVSASASPQPVQNEPPSASLPSPEPTHKKSLAHLFERASSGGVVGKDLSLQLPEVEQAETISQSVAHPVSVQSAKETTDAASTPSPVVESITREIEEDAQVSETIALISPELAQYIELWKNFYRLNSGEVDALSVLYRLSHQQGRAECYVKMHNLSEMSNLTYRYCQKVVRSLEQLGWITKLKDYDPTDQLGVLYRVNLKPSAPLP
jgi:DNA-binding MarR family transcriptional regulator